MKILFITDLYPVKEDELTTPRTLYEFVKSWQDSGHRVDVIKPNFLFNSFLRGKPYYKTGLYGNVMNINYWLPFMNVEPVLSEYDEIIAHMPSGILYADKLGLPFTAGVHVSDLEVLTNPFYGFYFKNRLENAYRHAKAIACRSAVIKNKFLKLYPEFEQKTFSVPSGIDEKIITPRIPMQNRECTEILTCANLIRRKNIDKLIQAVEDLDGVHLTVIGDGKEYKKLKNLAEGVTFTGRLSNNRVLEKMREADIFILPSVNETFGMVYLEAMASGCITVCSKEDGIDGIISDGENGFTVFPICDEIRKIILKIKNMDDDNIKKLSYNSFYTIKNYTNEKCAKNYLQHLLKFS